MKCPEHNIVMIGTDTKYGRRCHCPKAGCTYVWWDNGKINSPANQAMRDARQRAHKAFDQIWKENHLTRKQCYALLSELLQKKPPATHIGLFGLHDCDRVVDFGRRVMELLQKHPQQDQATAIATIRQSLNLKETPWPRSTK